MIISQSGRLAVTSLILLLFGGQADSRNINRQTATTTDSVYFATSWETLQQQYSLGTKFQVAWKVGESLQSDVVAQQGSLVLALLWTSAESGIPNSSNTFFFQNAMIYSCLVNTPLCDGYKTGSGGSAMVNLLATPGAKLPSPYGNATLGSFFFCFSINQDGNYITCESYSPFFELTDNPSQDSQNVQKRAINLLQQPTATLAVTQATNFLYPSGAQAPTVTPQAASSSAASPEATTTPSITSPTGGSTTVSVPPTGTTTVTPSATPTSSSSTGGASKSSKSGLGTGPIVGIAIGGFAFIVIAFLVIFFCCRRRQRKRTQPEQVLLRHNVHDGNRDMIAEKEGSEGPMLGSILETRSSSGAYDHLSASAPYSGNAGPGGLGVAGGLTAVAPRRSTTSATHATHTTFNTDISRGLSDASGPMSPRSTVRGDVDYEEPYHDEPMPVYGDARHIPQVYSGTLNAPFPSSSPTPFLSEPGMTDEELSRLEEEERRIDAAIAEAEGRRR